MRLRLKQTYSITKSQVLSSAPLMLSTRLVLCLTSQYHRSATPVHRHKTLTSCHRSHPHHQNHNDRHFVRLHHNNPYSNLKRYNAVPLHWGFQVQRFCSQRKCLGVGCKHPRHRGRRRWRCYRQPRRPYPMNGKITVWIISFWLTNALRLVLLLRQILESNASWERRR